MSRPGAGEGTGWPPVSHSWPSGAAPAGTEAGPGERGSATPAAVLAALIAAGATVAVAESLTGGLLTAALTEPAGASAAVRGGLVVYATELKAVLAGVPVPLLAAEGPVSPDVAAALAAGARDRLGATYGLGITGVAGPDPQGGKPVGTVYLGLAGPGGGSVRELRLTGDRAGIRAGSVAAALDLLLSVLQERSPEFRG
jgi:nicotinamide-nucleotide amidase